MKKGLFWLLLLPIIVSCLGVAYASDTNCWEWKWTVPTTTYASGIVYGCDGEIPIITIYWDNWSWKSFWITIKAMNEWTGTVTIWSLNNTGAYWSLYQWWNNYPFPSTADTITPIISWDVAISAEWYTPWTYSSEIRIKFSGRWDSSDNRNLWWGSWDEKNLNWFWWYDTENFEVINAQGRQAICPNGYHIPSIWEWHTLLYLWWKNYDVKQGTLLFTNRSLNNLNYKNSLEWTWTRFSKDMQIPFVGSRIVDSSVSLDGYGRYWSSTPFPTVNYARYFYLNPDNLLGMYDYGSRVAGYAIRCFKNEYVKPSYSLTFDTLGGSEVNTWIAEENTPRTRPENPTKSGYTLVDWYTSTGYDTVFDFTTLATGDLTVYAKWHDVRCGNDLQLDYDENLWICYKKDTTYNVPVYYGTDMNNSHSYNDNPIWTITVKLPDGNTLTMMDMNLWATVSWTTCSTTNTWVCGHHFQWWNNYGFESCYTNNCTGLITTWTRDIYKNYWLWHPYISDIFIYWGNIYDYWNSSKIWDSTQFHFDILRWGIWDSNDTTSIDTFRWWINNGKSRQWPCPSWYHVPSRWERNALITYRRKTKDSSCTCSYNEQCEIYSDNNFRLALKLPLAGFRTLNKASIYSQGKEGYYWTSSPVMNDNRAHDFYFYNSDGRLESSNRGIWLSLRCFKDSPKAPETLTLTFSGNGGNLLWTTSWILDQLVASWHLVQQPVNPTKTGATFQNWTKAPNGGEVFNFNIGLASWITLYAQYICNSEYIEIDWECVELYTITYNLNGWILSWDNENVTWYTIKSDNIILINPTKIWYTFTWRSGTDIEWFSNSVIIPSGSIWDRKYEANWEINQYTITFKDWDNEITTITADYWTWITPPANPTKDGYKFIGWEPRIPATMPAGDMTINVKWECADGYENKWWTCVKKSWWSSGGGWGWWGWWWGGSSSSCKNLPTNAVANNSSTPSSNTNYYYSTNTSKVCTFQCKSGYTRNEGKETCDKTPDNQTTTSWTNVKEPEGTWNNIKVETWNNTEIQTWSKIDTPEQTHQNDNSNTQDSSTSSQNDGKTYSTEFQEAYEFAKWNWITTMSTIQKANMNGKLTRIAMAKMLSQYAMNVLWQKPANIVTPKFNDVTDKQNSDYDGWVTLSYQLGIMWQNMPNNKFRPNDEVTRAEFATALSRMVYHTSDGEYKSTPKYYIHHMEKLVKEWIITKDDPEMKELRGYVMIMLMRSAK